MSIIRRFRSFDSPGTLCLAGCLIGFGVPTHAQTIDAGALPENGIVVSGAATLTPSSSSLQIDQTSERAIIQWDRFDIGQNASVNFAQPSSNAVALNRVLASDASQIMGTLSANGQVFLINPSGVLFGRDARVDVGGLVASTLDMRNEDFLAGNHVFESDGTAGDVSNLGTLRARDGGYIALLGQQVANEGIISARLGTVALAAGERITLDFNGDALLSLAVDRGAVGAQVANHQLIQAAGGSVYMSASAANDLAATVVNNTGIIEATSLTEHNGVIRLEGGERGTVAVSGRLDASGTDAGTTGGSIGVFGERIGLFDAAELDASGIEGGGTINVGGNFQGAGLDPNASRVYAGPETQLRADALNSGNGGDVIVWSDDATRFEGSISARGGINGGDGGFAEVSGKDNLLYTGLADLRAPSGLDGTLLLDPKNITIGTLNLDDLLFNDQFLENLTASVTVGVVNLLLQLEFGQVTLQANNDITLSTALNNLASFTSNALTLQAGRSIAVTSDVLLRGAFNATINSTGASSVNRDPGAATFTMAAGTTINTAATNSNISISVGTGVGTAGGGGIGTSSAPLRVAATHLEAAAQAGGAFFTAPSGSLTIGGATVGSLTGISTTGGGSIGITTSGGSITTSEAISAAAGGTIALTAGGASSALTIGAGLSSGNGALNLISANGITLSGATAQVSSTGAYTVNADSDANGTGIYAHNHASASLAAGPVSITAADVNLVGTIGSGSAPVLLAPSTTSATIGIGATANTFGISNAELGRITTTGLLTLGGATNTGGITVGTNEAVSFGSRTLALTTGGNLAVNATNGISGTGALTLNADTMALNGGAIGGANITLQPNTLTQTIGLNDAAGVLNLTAAELQSLSSSGTVTIGAAGGTGAINIGSLGAVDLSAANFALALRGGATVFGAGGLILPNNSTFTLAGTTVTGGSGTDVRIGGATGALNLNVTGNTSLTTQIARLIPTTVGGNLTINNTGALDVGAASLAGHLAVTTSGALTQSGALTVGATSTFNAGANALTLTHAANDFVGAVALTGSNVTLLDSNALVLDTSSVSGSLGVTTNGALSQLGALSVTGGTALNVGLGNDVTLNAPANDFVGAVSIIGAGNVTVADATALDLGPATIGGTLALAANGAVTDSGAITVGGVTTVNAGSNVVLLDAANDFATISIGSASGVTLNDVNAIDLGAITTTGNLSVTASAGDITTSGALNVAGNTNVTATQAGASVSLGDAGNQLAGALSIGGAGLANITIANTTPIALPTLALTGDLNVTAPGVSSTAPLQVGGVATITAGVGDVDLSAVGNDFNVISIASAGNVSLADSTSLTLGPSTIASGLTLTIGGTLDDSGPVSVGGMTLIDVGADVNLDDANDFATIGITSGANVLVSDTNSIDLGATDIAGQLTVTAGNAITQSAGLNVDAGLSLTASAGDITLAHLDNDISGSVSLTSGGDATLSNTTAVELGSTQVAGTLTINAGGAVSGTLPVNVGGDLSVTAGQSGDGGGITLTGGGQLRGTVDLSAASGGDVNVSTGGSIALGTVTGDNVTITGGGSITNAGGGINITATGTVGLNSGSGTVGEVDNPVIVDAPSTNTSAGGSNQGVSVNINNTSPNATHTTDTTTTPPGIVVVNGQTVGSATGSPNGLNPQTIPGIVAPTTNVGSNTSANPAIGPTSSIADAERTVAYETDSANRLNSFGCATHKKRGYNLASVNQGMQLPPRVAAIAAPTGTLEQRQQASRSGFCMDESGNDGEE